MPIPSPAPFRRSNLTKKQKQEELNAIYGVQMKSEITAAEIERMRELVADHDAEGGDNADFDPSKVRVPYVFKKFPMMVYNAAQSHPAYDDERIVTRGSLAVAELTHIKAYLASRIVNNQRELDAALADGYSENAPTFAEETEAPVIEEKPRRRRA